MWIYTRLTQLRAFYNDRSVGSCVAIHALTCVFSGEGSLLAAVDAVSVSGAVAFITSWISSYIALLHITFFSSIVAGTYAFHVYG